MDIDEKNFIGERDDAMVDASLVRAPPRNHTLSPTQEYPRKNAMDIDIMATAPFALNEWNRTSSLSTAPPTFGTLEMKDENKRLCNGC